MTASLPSTTDTIAIDDVSTAEMTTIASSSPAAPAAGHPSSTGRSNAIAIETLDGQGPIRRALLENCVLSTRALTPENSRLLAEFERGLDKTYRVIGVSAIRAFRNTGAANPRSEVAAEEVRTCASTHHAMFPIVALVTRTTTAAPCEIVRFDVSAKKALVRYGTAIAAGARAPSANVDVRVVLCCTCERSVHGDFMMPWSHFDQKPDAQESSQSPARVLTRQLQTTIKQLERFLAAPPPQFVADEHGVSPLAPLHTELRAALSMLESTTRVKRSHHASRPSTPLSTPSPMPAQTPLPVPLPQLPALDEAEAEQQDTVRGPKRERSPQDPCDDTVSVCEGETDGELLLTAPQYKRARLDVESIGSEAQLVPLTVCETPAWEAEAELGASLFCTDGDLFSC